MPLNEHFLRAWMRAHILFSDADLFCSCKLARIPALTCDILAFAKPRR